MQNKKKAIELKAGDIVAIYNSIYDEYTTFKVSDAKNIKSTNYVNLTLTELLKSGRWSSQKHAYSFGVNVEFLVASSKAEILKLIEEEKEKNKEEQLPIFAYGTLRRGEGNYRSFLKGETVAEMPATIKGNLLVQHADSIPYLKEGNGIVHGELMFVKPERFYQVLRSVDRLEGYSRFRDSQRNHYERKKIVATLEDGSEQEAYTYFAAGELPRYFKKIKSGNYLAQ